MLMGLPLLLLLLLLLLLRSGLWAKHVVPAFFERSGGAVKAGSDLGPAGIDSAHLHDELVLGRGEGHAGDLLLGSVGAQASELNSLLFRGPFELRGILGAGRGAHIGSRVLCAKVLKGGASGAQDALACIKVGHKPLRKRWLRARTWLGQAAVVRLAARLLGTERRDHALVVNKHLHGHVHRSWRRRPWALQPAHGTPPEAAVPLPPRVHSERVGLQDESRRYPQGA